MSKSKPTAAEFAKLLKRLRKLEALLDEADNDDYYGTQGWRYRLND